MAMNSKNELAVFIKQGYLFDYQNLQRKDAERNS